MRRVEKPWGYEIIWAETDSYVGKVLHVDKGNRLSLQYHEIKEETLFVFKGKILFDTGADKDNLKQTEVGEGEAFHIPPKTIHRFTSLEDTDLFEVSTNHLMDVVRLEDDYGREGTHKP